MKFSIDTKFREQFRNLKQVFMYITDECQLRCEQCIYKPSLAFHAIKDIPLNTALDLLSDFREMGASKTTFLGGEPTVYGNFPDKRELLALIIGAKRLGYEYLRLDTNGQFDGELLLKKEFMELDEIAFSLDGFSSDINDPIRGQNTFHKCVFNIKKAVELGYTVTITSCVHKKLCQFDKFGNPILDTMIRFAESIGVCGINFHDLFKVGVPMDTWTGNFSPTVEEWIRVYDKIYERINNREYDISVRLPQCFVDRDEFNNNPEYYGYCPVKLGERIMVHPNGIIRICSNLICTAYGVANYYNNRIVWNRSNTNEMLNHKLTEYTPCTNRSLHKNYGKHVPLCFSFKPGQDEIIWKDKLQWDTKQNILVTTV